MTITQAINTLIGSPDTSERRFAAEEIISRGELDISTVKALVKGLTDDDLGVRDICFRALATAVGDFALIAAKAVAPLIENKNIEIRNLAGDILLSLGDKSIDALLPYLRHDDEDVRKYALDIIGTVGSDDNLGSVFPLLEDPDMNVRCSAIEAIGNIKAEIALGELIRLYFTDDELKPFIISAIAKIGGEKAQSFLSERLKQEDDFFLQTACIDGLSLCGEDFGICLELFSILADSPEELQPILLKTIYAIAFRIGEPLDLPDNLKSIALTALADDDPDIRAAGLIALGDSYRLEDIESLLAELQRNNSETKQHIIYNMLASTDTEVCFRFFKSYFNNSIIDGSVIELIGMACAVAEAAQSDNLNIFADLALDLVFKEHSSFGSDILELLTKLNRKRVLDRFKSNLLHNEESVILETLDYINTLKISELAGELESMNPSGTLLSERVQKVICAIKENTKF